MYVPQEIDSVLKTTADYSRGLLLLKSLFKNLVILFLMYSSIITR